MLTYSRHPTRTPLQHLRLRNPDVNARKDKYEYPEWHFIEVANEIRNIKNN